MIKAETVNYDVHTVEYGIYQKNNSRSVSEVYPYTYQLRFEQSGATFVEYYVRRGDEVKKGDVLASFSLETDDVTLTSKKLSLKRMENAFPFNTGKSGQSCQRLHFVDYDRIDYVCRDIQPAGYFMGDHSPEIGSVLPIISSP